MSPEETIEKRHKALMALVEYARIKGERDDRIAAAVSAGVPVTEVATLVGLNRQHVHAILKGRRDAEA